MVYVRSSVSDMYLSHESLLNLGLLPPTFPSVNGSAAQPRAPRAASSVGATREVTDGCSTPPDARDAPCSCPLREVAPQRPPVLPFPCTPENNKRMKAWLLQRYAPSTFNTCPHRALLACKAPQWKSTLTPQPHLRHATPLRTCPYIGSSGSTLTSSATKP